MLTASPMDLIRDVVIAVIGGGILLFLQWLWTHWREWRGELTGEWEQVIFDAHKSENIVSRDAVDCRQYGAVMRASIKRQYPDDQRYRAWYFSGRYDRSVIFGHFWAKKQTDPSFGTIFLRQVERGRFRGYYMRLDHVGGTWNTDIITLQAIPLEWRRVKKSA